jgi:hypothetical protein
MQVLAIIGGVILLLPGLCSLGFITLSVSNLSRGGMRDAVSWAPLWIVCFAISFGGIMMIRRAIRRIN